MRQPKEIVVLVLLMVLAVAFVIWYVVDRRAQNKINPPAPVTKGPLPEPIDLKKVEGKTVDFSTGKAVVKDSADDRAALEAGLKDIEAALKEVKFDPEPPAPPKK